MPDDSISPSFRFRADRQDTHLKKEKKIMRKAVVFFFGAVLLTAFAGTALADAGGTPNSNASTQNGNGRKAACPPPGSIFKQYAQMPGPNNDPGGLGMTPG